ncbi:MAG: hypothetical protein P1P63_05995 [Treponemataceae bacterium]
MIYETLTKKIKELPESCYDEIDLFLTDLSNRIQHSEKQKVDIESLVIPTERGKNADSYIMDLRNGDRI